ncbi:MAG TPA: hypothetical protein VMV86_01215, partial [Methanosarcinales archaeon]|nr:hypothetical protein [Methanosarcinales archaeon]
SAAPDSVNPGELFTSMNEPLGTNFQFSPLSFWKERVKWPEGATVSDQPECKSVDGVRGFWRQAEWLACDRCPYSKWDPKGGVNGQGGYPCKESVNVLGMDADIKDFYRIQFHGSNVKIGRKFHSIIKNRSEIFDAVWKISTQKHPKAPTFQYKVPEKVRDVAADEDVFHVNDFFIDVIEKVREEMKDRQDFYINQAGDMAADAPDDVGTVDSSEAAPDFNM